MSAVRPNAFQRWYFRYAEKYYQRMTPELRAEVERVDRFLYSRDAAFLWGLLLGLVAGTAALLAWKVGIGWVGGTVVSVAMWTGVAIAGLGAWLKPEGFTLRTAGLKLVLTAVATVTGALTGIVAARWSKGDALQWDQMKPAIAKAMAAAAPVLVAVVLLMTLGMLVVSAVRRWQMARELEHLSLLRERDSAARQASEAQLQLLRAQIQPHFIFNTLSAVQHWVDTGDPRASTLLRELSAFLRQSTQLLSQREVSLGAEVAMLGHYLAIMQARLGERLRYRIDVAPEAAAQPMPPGLLVTLAENAVEHGIAPSLQGGSLQVRAWREGGCFLLDVVNTGVPLPAQWREGVGLRNTRERLQHRFGEHAGVSLQALPDGATRARVRVGEAA